MATQQRAEGRDQKCSSEVRTRSRTHPSLPQQEIKDALEDCGTAYRRWGICRRHFPKGNWDACGSLAVHGVLW
jgi:hypothetical protein